MQKLAENCIQRAVFAAMIILSLVVVVPGQQPQGSSEEQREAICRKVPCRPQTTVRLRLNEKEYAEFDFPKGPYVADGFINVLNGEEFGVEFDDKGGSLLASRYVKEIVHPERTVSVKLDQLENGTVLKITNPFSKSIVYDCLIQHYQQEKLTKTSIIPVPARLMSFESWPYPITQVVISSVRYQPAKVN